MTYRQLRHTYGFGVHSPFAYRLVKDVVRPGRGYAWYGYEDIDAAVNSRKAGVRIERQSKMFLRLIAFLNPQSLFLPLGIDPLFFVAAQAMGESLKIKRKPRHAVECSMIGTHSDFLPLPLLKGHLSSPGKSLVIMDYPPEWRDELFDALPQGLILYSNHNAIIVNRPEMMKVAYKILL